MFCSCLQPLMHRCGIVQAPRVQVVVRGANAQRQGRLAHQRKRPVKGVFSRVAFGVRTGALGAAHDAGAHDEYTHVLPPLVVPVAMVAEGRAGFHQKNAPGIALQMPCRLPW